MAARSIGAPGLVTSRALLASAPAWQVWRDDLVAIVGAATEANLATWLNDWRDRVTSDDALVHSQIAGSIYQAGLHADMAAQLFVRTIEVPESLPREVRNDGEDRFNPFLDMTPEEALAYFRGRRLVTPEEFARMDAAARMRSFTATRLASDALVQRCRDLLDQSIANGTTYREFASALAASELSLGVEPSSPFYVETVYRTNVQAAYGAGRFRQITSAAVRSVRPYVEYRTVRDDRVRPAHRALDGVVFSQDDPDWPQYAPPNSYNCRCSCVARRASDVSMGRVVSAASLGAHPDENFAAPPTLGDAG